MARKRMSLRAIAAMKRENRALRGRLEQLRSALNFPNYQGVQIAHGTICVEAGAAIRTSAKLGFLNVVIPNDSGSFQVRAIKPDFSVEA